MEQNNKLLIYNIVNEFCLYYELNNITELNPELFDLYKNVINESNNIFKCLKQLYDIYDSFFMEDPLTIKFNEFIINLFKEYPELIKIIINNPAGGSYEQL